MKVNASATRDTAVPVVTRVSSALLQRKCDCGQHTIGGAKCEECREKSGMALQRRAMSQTGPATVPPIVHEVLRSPGQPLDRATRDFMEPRFGRDFSGVRVHTDAQAAESAQAVTALAYTVGRDVVFGKDQYSPGSLAGNELLAHELTHVVQQENALQEPPQALRSVSGPQDPAEREAARVAAGERVRVMGVPDPLLQRALATDDPEELLKLVPNAKKKLSREERAAKAKNKAMIDELFKPPTQKDFRPEDADTRLPAPDDLHTGYKLYGESQKFGRIEAIDAFTHVAREWARIHPDFPISVNAIGNKGGGLLHFLSKPGYHKSHDIGLDFDISLHDQHGNNLTNLKENADQTPTKNADGTVIYTTGGNTALSREFATFIRTESPLKVTAIYFNDPRAGTTYQFGHNDHFHVRFAYTRTH